jgi:phosphoserine phosphatase
MSPNGDDAVTGALVAGGWDGRAPVRDLNMYELTKESCRLLSAVGDGRNDVPALLTARNRPTLIISE